MSAVLTPELNLARCVAGDFSIRDVRNAENTFFDESGAFSKTRFVPLISIGSRPRVFQKSSMI
jgi:hypothetical protein